MTAKRTSSMDHTGLKRGRTMKKIIIFSMVLVMMLLSIGGCWMRWDRDGRDGRGEQHERDQRHDQRR